MDDKDGQVDIVNLEKDKLFLLEMVLVSHHFVPWVQQVVLSSWLFMVLTYEGIEKIVSLDIKEISYSIPTSALRNNHRFISCHILDKTLRPYFKKYCALVFAMRALDESEQIRIVIHFKEGSRS